MSCDAWPTHRVHCSIVRIGYRNLNTNKSSEPEGRASYSYICVTINRSTRLMASPMSANHRVVDYSVRHGVVRINQYSRSAVWPHLKVLCGMFLSWRHGIMSYCCALNHLAYCAVVCCRPSIMCQYQYQYIVLYRMCIFWQGFPYGTKPGEEERVSLPNAKFTQGNYKVSIWFESALWVAAAGTHWPSMREANMSARWPSKREARSFMRDVNERGCVNLRI